MFMANVFVGSVKAVDPGEYSGEFAGEIAQASLFIEEENFTAANSILLGCLSKKPSDADVLNLLGYTARLTSNLGDAASYYAEALESNPNHLGALEYQGELFLDLGRPKKAKLNLDRIRSVCGVDCEEYQDLAEEIRAFHKE